MNLFAKQKQRHRYGEQTQDTECRGRRHGQNWNIGIDIYTLPCIKEITNDNLQETQLSALWGPKWKEHQKERGDIYN